MSQFLTTVEIKKIGDLHAEGISSKEIVKIFQAKGIRFSEATFRKYVQMGLVERCRRVGQKGKHRGSHGLYPVSTIQRINSIKKMISGDITLEQLRGSYFSMRQKIEEVERIVVSVLGDVRVLAKSKAKSERQDVQLSRDLENLGKNAKRIINSLEKMEGTFFQA